MKKLAYIKPKNTEDGDEIVLVTKEVFEQTLKNVLDQVLNSPFNSELSNNIEIKPIDIDGFVQELEDKIITANKSITEYLKELDLQTSTNITEMELTEKINDLKRTIIKNIQTRFDNILNSKDSLQQLKSAMNLVNTISETNEISTQSIDTDELGIHLDSDLHITNEDRIALNKLLNLSVFADWNAKETDDTFIKNKPESLPANGGNADTLDNHTLSQVINHQLEDYIIGSPDEDYPVKGLDVVVTDLDDFLKSKLNDKCRISVKKGCYSINCDLYRYRLNSKYIVGAGTDLTLFEYTTLTIDDNFTLKDTKFEECTISIFGKMNFISNNIFKSCTLIFYCCESILTNNFFYNCDIHISDEMLTTVLANNVVVDSTHLEYKDSNNNTDGNVYL